MTSQRHARYKGMVDEGSPLKDIQVWYHGPGCTDGFGAAWAAHMKFADTAEYVSIRYGDRVPEIPEGTREVYLLDFCFTRDTILKILAETTRRGIKFVLLDHHKSAREDLDGIASTDGLYLIRFNEEKSGAVLAWEHFHPRWGDVPELLLYVQDRDLWQWKMPRSREFATWLRSVPLAFDDWNSVACKLDVPEYRDHIFTEAAAMHRLIESQVRTLVKQSWLGTFMGFSIPIGNVQLHQSEVGEALNERFPETPFSATYYDRPEGDRVWSLRSKGGFDCQALASTVKGGGGHPGAAGFRSTLQNYVLLVDNSVPSKYLFE